MVTSFVAGEASEPRRRREKSESHVETGAGKVSAIPFVLVLLLLAPGGGLAAPPEPGPVEPTAVVRHGKGELRIVEGVPFLKLAGTYREMGVDYGALLGDRIRELLDVAGMPELARHASWIDRWRLRRRFPRHLLDLIDGIAEGSGLPRDQVFWLSFAMPGGCSSFLVRSGEGLLHAHNQDRPQDGRFKAVVEFAPEKRYRYVLTSYVGTIDVLEGMNEKGITLTQDAASGRPTTSETIPFHIRNREILESAASLKDVEAVLDRRPGDWNLLVIGSAADGTGAAYDLAGGRWFKTPLDDRSLVATNTHLAAALGEHPEECPRRASLERLLKVAPVSGVRDVVALLGDPGTLRGTNNELTVHSLVLDPEHRLLYASFGSAYAAWGRWLRYDWLRDQVTVLAEPKVDLGRHEVRLKSMPAHQAAYVRATLPSAEAQVALWTALWRRVDDAAVPGVPSCTTYQGEGRDGVELELRIPVLRRRVPPGLPIVEVPAAVVASTLHQGPDGSKPLAYLELRRWMARNGYVEAGPATECYLKRAQGGRAPSSWLTEIRVPVSPTDNGEPPAVR